MTKINRVKKPTRLLFLLPLILAAFVPPASAAPNYLPVVKAGNQWTVGDIELSCSSVCDLSNFGPFLGLRSIQILVDNVTGYTVGLNTTFTNYNGQSGSSTSYDNTLTGSNFLVIAGGLSAGDPISNSTNAPRINGTTTRFYAGQNRPVNYLQTNFPGPNGTFYTVAQYWDQQYGAVVELSERIPVSGGQGMLTLDLRVTSTNLWSPTSPDFSLSATEPSTAINAGQGTNSIVTLTSLQSLPGPVQVSAIVNPPISSHPLATPNPSSVSFNPTTGTSTLTITTSTNTLPGIYTITVVANYTTISHFKTLYLNVTGPDFTISALPSYLNFQGPGTQTSTIILRSLQGFTGTVALTVSPPQPNGPQLSLTSSSLSLTANGSANATLMVTVPAGTPPRYYPNNYVMGISGPFTHSVGITVNVQQPFPQFELTASPASLTLPEGTVATSIITITSLQGFSGTLRLTASGYPLAETRLNVTSVTLSPTAPSAHAELAVAAFNEPGNEQVFVQGNDQNIYRGINVNLTVTPPGPDFVMVASPSGFFEQNPGGSFSAKLTLTSLKGYADTINIAQQPPSASCEPMLATANTTVSLPANGSTSTMLGFTVPICTPAGYDNVVLTATGTNLPLHHTTYVSFSLNSNSTTPNFTLYPATSSRVIAPQGSAGNMTITVRSLNGFSGIVAVTDLTDGVVSPGSVSLLPNGSANVTLTKPLNFNFGYYNFASYVASSLLRATSGPISHTKYVEMNATSVGGFASFSVSANNGNLQLSEGHQVGVTFTIADVYPFTFSGTVDLGAIFDKQHLAVSLNQTSVKIGPGHDAHVLMTVNNASTSSVGLWRIIMTARSAGTTSTFNTVVANVTSQAVPDFGIRITPTFSSILDGTYGKATLTLKSLNGFTGTVDLISRFYAQILANNSHIFLSPGQTVNVTIWVRPYYNSYNPSQSSYEVTGVSDSIVYTLAEFTTITPRIDFGLSPSLSTLTVASGSSSSSAIQVYQNDVFTSPVSLTALYPPELTVHITPSTITPSIQQTANVTVTGSVPGSYPLIVTATSGQIVHSTILVVNITPPTTPTFSITASPPSLVVAQGGHASGTITARSLNGFSGTISLTVTAPNLPPVLLNATSITLLPGSNVTLTLKVQIPSNTQIGQYTITVSGTNGTFTYNLRIPLIVTPFEFRISANPFLMNIVLGAQAKSTITVSAVNGQGTVYLSTGPATGVSCSLDQTILTLNTTRPTGTSTLTCTANSVGTYKVTISGYDNGGFQQAITVTVFVPRIPYLPAVKVGNSFMFMVSQDSFTSSDPSLQAPPIVKLLSTTSHIDITVTAVSGTNVTLKQAWNYNNGTQPSIGYITLNVATGAYNTTGIFPTPTSSNTLLAAGLQAPDHLIEDPSSPTLNMTAARTVLGATRIVNFLNMTIANPYQSLSTGSAWDQTSGIIVNLYFHLSGNLPQGGTASLTIELSVNQTNIWAASSKPIINLVPASPNPANTGQLVTVAFTISSPSSSPVTTLTVNWGDGTPTETLQPTSTRAGHYYYTTGTNTHETFTINVTATNGAGSTFATTTETINDQSPTVTISNVSPSPATTGQTVTVVFSSTDPDGTTSSYTVNWGDGTTNSLSPPATSDTHKYTTAYPYTITVTATDNSGSTGSSSTPITVTGPKTTATLSVSCVPTSILTGSTTVCTTTVTGSYPSGTVTLSTNSTTGAFTPTTGSCTLDLYGQCALVYTDTATSNITATITATYSGDSYNTGATGSTSLKVVKSSTVRSTTTLTVSCSANTIQVGTFTTCTVTVVGSSPSGMASLSSTSLTGYFAPATGLCTLSASGTCSVIYTDTATANTTATLNAYYLGDAHNLPSTKSTSLAIVKPASSIAAATSSVTLSSGTAGADQTPTTGVSVQITGSTSPNGTPVAINTQHLNSPSPSVGTVSLSGASYYDVVITGTSTGTAKVCISYSSASSSTTMQYWTGTAWIDASSVTVTGTTVCGQIPVSSLTGTNVAVGNSASQPSNNNLLFIIAGVVAAVVVVVAVIAVFRRRGKTVKAASTP